MSSPNTGGGGIGQAASELLKEMQKAQSEMQQVEAKQPGGPNEAFQQAMQVQQAQTQNVGSATQVNAPNTGATSILQQAKVNMESPSTKVGTTEKVEQSRLASMLESLINGQDKMNTIMHLALSGKQFSPTELLAMQAGVYRFTQELDLTSKVVEKATGGIKQTLNTQV